MSGFDLQRLVEAVGPLARLSLETDAEGEPRVVRLEPLPPEVQRMAEAAASIVGARTEFSAAPPPSIDPRVCLAERSAHDLVEALLEARSMRTKLAAAVDLDAVSAEKAADVRLQIENAEAMAWEQFRADVGAVLGDRT